MNKTTYKTLISGALVSIATLVAAPGWAACTKDCGTVVDLRTVKKQGEGSGLGAVLGGVAFLKAHGIALLITASLLTGIGLSSVSPISVSLFVTWFGGSARRASGPVFAMGNMGGADAVEDAWSESGYALNLTLPPLSVLLLKPEPVPP